MRSRLNVALAEAGVTKRELARRMGVTPETVYRWSIGRGIASVTLGRIERIARELGVDPESLYEWSGQAKGGSHDR